MNRMGRINDKALNISAVSTIVLITALTILGEISKRMNDILKSITGHHWVSKGVISIVFFLIVYILLSNSVRESEDKSRYVYYTVYTAIICGIIIFLFYLFEFFN